MLLGTTARHQLLLAQKETRLTWGTHHRAKCICNSLAMVIGCYWRFAMLSSCAIDRCWMDVTSENGAKLQKTLRLTPNNRLL